MSYYVNGDQFNGTPKLAPAGMQKGFELKANRDRNKPIIKAKTADVVAALAAHDRIQAISDEIRGRAGLAPVAESDWVSVWRGKAKTWKSTVKGPVRNVAPDSLSARAEALRASRDKLAKAQAKIDRETAEIASAVKGTREVSKVAAILGLSRQRLYQVAA